MHEPTTQTRPAGGAALITASSEPGTPIASNTTGIRVPSAALPRLDRVVARGSTADARAHRERDGTTARREVGDHDRLHAEAPQLGHDREADRPRTEHDRGLRRRDRGAGDGVATDRHRLGERGASMVEPVRHLHAHRRREPHPIGVRAVVDVRVRADRFHTRSASARSGAT